MAPTPSNSKVPRKINRASRTIPPVFSTFTLSFNKPRWRNVIFFAKKKGKTETKSDKSQSSNLNQGDNDDLPEQ